MVAKLNKSFVNSGENLICNNNYKKVKNGTSKNLSGYFSSEQMEIQSIIQRLESVSDDENENVMENETKIQQFYSGSVFITGGTGFLGKILIEKLLRSCPRVDTIYLLVRSKKGKNMDSRVEEIFNDVLFRRLHKEQPKSRFKVVGIKGDMGLPNLGISNEDQKLITNKVSFIFHCAATVRFDEKLKTAVAINIKGTSEIINIANECEQLKSVVHVSTAFAHCFHTDIDEIVYDCDTHYETLISLIDGKTERELETIRPRLLTQYQNSYCLTKAAAENLVKERGQHLPICIFRPAIVIATYKEPIRSWIDNLYGATGVIVGAGSGLIRVINVDKNSTASIVPGDYVVNALLAAGCENAYSYKSTENQQKVKVYNYVASKDNPITWGEFCDLSIQYGINYPTIRAIWYFYLLKIKSGFVFTLLSILLHFIPALLADIFLICSRNKFRLLKVYKKINKFNDVIAYFALQQWNFSNDNVVKMWDSLSSSDKKLFPFDMNKVNWIKYAETHVIGLRQYLVKDDITTLPEARRKWKKLYLMHRFVQFLVVVFTVKFLVFIISSIYNLF